MNDLQANTDANAPWLCQAWALIFDLGLPPGNIEDRMFEAIGMVRTIINQRDELIAAIRQTLNDNGHLADGDVCTLKVLKDALAKIEESK